MIDESQLQMGSHVRLGSIEWAHHMLTLIFLTYLHVFLLFFWIKAISLKLKNYSENKDNDIMCLLKLPSQKLQN